MDKPKQQRGRPVTLYMLPDVERGAREIGSGNLSAGVALAVREHRISKQGVQARKAKRAKK